MVAISQIRDSIAQLTEATVPHVAVFVGGTSGIGKATIGHLARLKLAVKVYIVGRKSTEAAMRPFMDELRNNNPKAHIIWVEAEVALLSEVKRVCGIVKEAESKIDLLFLSAGYAPFAGRNNTSEGIDVTHALEYYGRMLFIHHLLPLLRASNNTHVVSVLSGSFLNRRFITDDLNLDKPGAFGGIQSQTQMGTMNTLTMDRFASAEENSNITFIHDWPGAVDTGNMKRYWKWSLFSPMPLTTLLKPVFWIMGFDISESAERHLYIATSRTFGGKGTNTKGDNTGGLYLLNNKCDVSYDDVILKELKDQSQETVWAKTMEILRPNL